MLVVSDIARCRAVLLGRRDGRPRSMIDDSDWLRLWDAAVAAMGSFRSTLGEPRLEAGDAVLNGFVKAVGGVERGMVFGDRRKSIALSGVFPAEVIVAGVMSCVLLALELSIRGAGEPLRSPAGDFGGTWGGKSRSPRVAVSSFSVGLGLAMGLMIGDSGFAEALGVSVDAAGVVC